jgi:hypothetical protein
MRGARCTAKRTAVGLGAGAVLLLTACYVQPGERFPERDVWPSYQAFLHDQTVVGAHPADLRPLAEHAADQVLTQLQERFSRLHASGYVALGAISAKLRSQINLQEPNAVIDVCVDATKFRRYDAKTHKRIDRSGRPPQLQRVTLRKASGTWKVATIAVVGPCKRR